MGTVPSILIQEPLERLQALPTDAVIEGTLINDYYQVMGVSALQYGLAIAGVFVFINATKNKAYSVPNYCDERLEIRDYPRVCIFNIGVIAFLIIGVGQCVLSLFTS